MMMMMMMMMMKFVFSNPLSPNINMHILLSVLHILLTRTSWKNLHKYQDFACLVIISFTRDLYV